MQNIAFDIAHLFAGTMVMISFILLYQNRISGAVNFFAIHAFLLVLSVSWQAFINNAPHLYITAGIALTLKVVIIPIAMRRIILSLGIHQRIEKVIGVGLTMMFGVIIVMVAILVMLPITQKSGIYVQEDMAFSLSIMLLGFFMMIVRRNAIAQIIGFMTMENGLILAATGANGMPLVIEITTAFSALVAFSVFGIFLFRIKERFDTVDVAVIHSHRGGS